MWSIISLRALLIISAVFALSGGSGGFPYQPDFSPDLEDPLNLTAPMRNAFAVQLEKGEFMAPPKWRKNPVFCCICQNIVKKTKPKMDKKIQLKINRICNSFINPSKSRCLSTGVKLKYKILQAIFPGNTPRATCQKAKLCS